MTTPYATLEATGGSPVELYLFVAGATTYAYTSFTEAITWNGVTFEPTIIKRDATKAASDSSRIQLDVGLGIQTPLAQLFVNGASPIAVACTIYRYQLNSPPSAAPPNAQVVTIFSGVVTKCSREGAEATLLLTPPQWLVQTAIPRFRYQLICNHALYDAGCTVSKASFTIAGTVAAVSADGRSDVVITVSSAPDPPYYTGGILVYGSYQGFIEQQVTPNPSGTEVQLVLLDAIPGLAATASVSLIAGCDRTYPTCINKFSNGPNHFGFPYVVNSDPWAGAISTADLI